MIGSITNRVKPADGETVVAAVERVAEEYSRLLAVDNEIGALIGTTADATLVDAVKRLQRDVARATGDGLQEAAPNIIAGGGIPIVETCPRCKVPIGMGGRHGVGFCADAALAAAPVEGAPPDAARVERASLVAIARRRADRFRDDPPVYACMAALADELDGAPRCDGAPVEGAGEEGTNA